MRIAARRFVKYLILFWISAMLLPSSVYAAGVDCEYLSGSNDGAHQYTWNWAAPVKSYLTVSGSGFMRVQGFASKNDESGVYAVYYDSNYRVTERKRIPDELPVFGGFYETASNFYLVTGQENKKESDSVEVFRITKYDKKWNRIGACGLFGANTYIPFDAGSCRMDSTGDYLVIRTSHEMYASPDDGLHHQANVTILVNTKTMTIAQSFTDTANNMAGYASHSFNQFVKLENNKIVAVDHGDAYPRSICLMNYPTDVTTGRFMTAYNITTTNVLSFPGNTGQNFTGAMAGGFEISGSAYLIAGCSVRQDDSFTKNRTYNVFVASVNKSTKAVTMNWITDYPEGETAASNPHLVKTGTGAYMLLWSRGSRVFYTKLDAAGKKTSEIYEMEGSLSDCVPVAANGKLIWYTWENEEETFYEISIASPAQTDAHTVTYGHEYEWNSTKDGVASLTCKKCGEQTSAAVPTSFDAYFREAGSSGYWYYMPISGMEAGAVMDCSVFNSVYSSDLEMRYGEYVFETDAPEYNTVEIRGSQLARISFSKAGTYQITVYPKYNPDLKKTYPVTIVKEVESLTLRAEPAETVYGNYVSVNASADGGKGNLTYTYTVKGPGNDGAEKVLRENVSAASITWKPDAAGTYTLKAVVRDAGDNNREVESNTALLTVRQDDLVMSPYLAAASHLTYGQKLSELAVTGKSVTAAATRQSVSGTFAFDAPEEVPGAGEREAAWTFTPASPNYKVLHGTLSFTVDQAEPLVSAGPSAAEVTYSPSAAFADIPLSGGEVTFGGKTVDGTWHWADEKTVPEVPGGEYDVIFVPKDTANYKNASAKASVTVRKAVPYVKEIKTEPVTYGGTLSDAVLSGTAVHSSEDGTAVSGTFVWQDGRISPAVSDSGTTAYTYFFTPDDTKNYEGLQGSATVTVEKAAAPWILPPSEISVPYTVEQADDTLLADYSGWHFAGDAPAALTAGETVQLTAVYSGEDAENFENLTAPVNVTRSLCMHDGMIETRNNLKASCTEPGWTGDTYCLACGEKLASGTEVPPLGHRWTQGEFTRGTCSERAHGIEYCERCDETREYIGEYDPDNHSGITTEEGYPATDKAEGRTERVYCTGCGAVIKEAEVIPKKAPIRVTGVSLGKETIELPATQSTALHAVVLPENATDPSLTFKSSAPDIASVDKNGVVTGHRIGTAVITATSVDGGKKASQRVRVLFSDVTNRKLANFEAIYSLVDRNVIAGFKNGEFFAPNDSCTRAQVVLFMWRAAGKPQPAASKLNFADAAEIEKLAPQYKQAILWGSEQGFVKGFTSGKNKGKFVPNDPCTRAQIVLFLYRFAGKPAVNNVKVTFTDKAEIASLAPDYTKAINWAFSKKITQGFKVSGGYEFRPNVNCTRGECATFLYRQIK